MWPFRKTESRIADIETATEARDGDETALAAALGLIFEFLRLLAADPIDVEVRDESELPAAKTVLINAFRLVLMVETRAEWRNAFYNAGIKLAYYWPDIGPARLRLPEGIFEKALTIDDKAEDRFERLRESEAVIHSFSQAFSKVGPENNRIAAIFDAAIDSIHAAMHLDDDYEIDTGGKVHV